MSVIDITQASIRPFAGYPDPGLPAGYWFAVAQILGDASGGLMSTFMRFQTVNQPSPSIIWSLEQLTINSDVANTRGIRLQLVNMDNIPGELNFAANYALTLTNLAFTTGASLNNSTAPLPLFLGQPVDNNLSSGIQVDDANVTGTTLSMRGQGYFWRPGAINAIGGVRRPVDGLYSR